MSGLNIGNKPAAQAPAAQPTDSQKEGDAVIQTPKSESEQADSFKDNVADKVSESGVVRWSSHPIQRFTVGNFQFERGLLVLDTEARINEFQATYDGLPIYEQSRIKKLDLAAAEAQVREALASGGGATKTIDSSVGDRAPNAAVGHGDLLDDGK